MRCNRRKFIKQCIALYGSLLLLPACDLKKGRQSFVSFTEEQADCIGAICEQIIPTDEYPGALDAGVLNYIDKQLYQRFSEQKARYEAGVKAVNAYCKEILGKNFVALEWDVQTKVLQDMESNKLPEKYWQDISQSGFFWMVRQHTMQGFYGPPHHGGNKDYVSYRMMKLDYPFLVGQNRYGK